MDDNGTASASGLVIRRAGLDDAAAIGSIHAISQHATYRGIVPDSSLAGITPDERLAWWTRALTQRDEQWIDLVVEVNRAVVGFSSTGPSGFSYGSTFSPFDLYCLYILPEWERHGLGSALVGHTFTELRRRGVTQVQLLCLRGTPAHLFYEAKGGRLADVGEHEEGGAMLPHAIYVYDLA